MTARIAIAGVGRMGLALAEGLVRSGDAFTLDLFEPTPGAEVRRLTNDARVRLNPDKSPCDVLILAVKPQVFRTLAPDFAPLTRTDTTLVSIMAGIDMSTISSALGCQRVLRAMPNLPGQIGEGITGFAVSPELLGTRAEGETSAFAKAVALLSAFGATVGPMDESSLPMVTGVSGSGPAYVFALVETLAEAGIREGLSAEDATRLARQTIIGAAALLKARPDTTASALREAVTSPGGTTAAALSVLMRAEGLPSLMGETVRAAVRRDRELGAKE